MADAASRVTVGPSDVELAIDGDEAAFTRLVSIHHAGMMRVAYAICGDATTAEEAVQSAWLKAWDKLSSVRDPARLRSWLVSIAANETRQQIRRDQRARVVEIDPRTAASEHSDPSSGIGRLDLRRALSKLGPDDRALLALRYVAGLDAAEIGGLTGRTASGTRARLSRITARVREDLGR